MLLECFNNLDWSRMDDIYDRMVFPDKTYDFVTGKQLFIEQMISYFPQEENAIKKYIELVNQVFKSSLSYYSNKALPGIIGSITYPFMTKSFLRYAARSTKDVLSEIMTKKMGTTLYSHRKILRENSK